MKINGLYARRQNTVEGGGHGHKDAYSGTQPPVFFFWCFPSFADVGPLTGQIPAGVGVRRVSVAPQISGLTLKN